MTPFTRPERIPAPPPPIAGVPDPIPRGVTVLTEEEASVFRHPFPEEVWEIARQHGNKISFEKPTGLHYLLTHPRAVQEVLVDKQQSFLKGDQETVMAAAIGWGLIVEEDESHRRQQQALSPSLRGEALNRCVQTIRHTAENFVGELRSGKPTELVDWARRFTQTSAEGALFGSITSAPDFRYHRELLVLNDMAMWGVDASQSATESIQAIRDFRVSREFVLAYVDDLASRWRETDHGPATLLDVIMTDPSSHAGVEGGLKAQIALFLQASVETTASLISWLLVALSNHPQYGDRVAKEVEASHDAGDFRRLVAMPWHQALINETLRLYPPAWMFPRIAREKVEIDSIEMEPGTRVLLSPWVTQRNPEFFDQPEQFWPERWLLDDWAPRRGSYYPFGLGSRICIGERYARLTATLMLSALAQLGGRLSTMAPDDTNILASLISGPALGTELSLSFP